MMKFTTTKSIDSTNNGSVTKTATDEHHHQNCSNDNNNNNNNNNMKMVSSPIKQSIKTTTTTTSDAKFCNLSSSVSSTTTQSSYSNSNSSSLDDIEQNCAHILPNELIISQEQNQAIAIEVPANTLKIDLSPFRPATEVHPEPGDIIEFDRTLYSQWAIYVGDGDVVVIVGLHIQDSLPDSETAHVQRAPLIVVAGEHFCRVNNKILRAKERNLLPFHNEIVVRKALSKVGTTVPYNALQCNAEHYVTEWKYGQRWSDQANVSMSSFKALRLQHTNSISESHNLFVNTLNEVLNSPAVSHSSAGSALQSPSSPIQIQLRTNRSTSMEVGGNASSTSPPTIHQTTSTRTHSMPGTFNTAGCQTELSFF